MASLKTQRAQGLPEARPALGAAAEKRGGSTGDRAPLVSGWTRAGGRAWSFPHRQDTEGYPGLKAACWFNKWQTCERLRSSANPCVAISVFPRFEKALPKMICDAGMGYPPGNNWRNEIEAEPTSNKMSGVCQTF